MDTKTNNFTSAGTVTINGTMKTGGTGTVTVKDLTIAKGATLTANTKGLALSNGGTVTYSKDSTITNGAKFTLSNTAGNTAVFTDGTSTMSLTGASGDTTATDLTPVTLADAASRTGYNVATGASTVTISADGTDTKVLYTKGA